MVAADNVGVGKKRRRRSPKRTIISCWLYKFFFRDFLSETKNSGSVTCMAVSMTVIGGECHGITASHGHDAEQMGKSGSQEHSGSFFVSAHRAVRNSPSHSCLVYGSFQRGDGISVSEHMRRSCPPRPSTYSKLRQSEEHSCFWFVM